MPPSRYEPGPDLRALATRIAEGVAVCREGRIAWASPRLAAMAGCDSPEALLGRRPLELVSDAGDGLPEIARARACRCRLRRAGAADRSVTVLAAEVNEAEQVWVFQDLTPSEQRDELLSVVSHELRTPVTVITGYNRLLLSERVGPLNEDQRRFLEECTKSCQRLNDFIANLLSAARASRGEEIVDKSATDLVGAIAGVAGFLRPLAQEKRIELKLAPAPRGAGHAAFDPLRIEQVLMNLLANAIRYARSEIEVAVAPVELEGVACLEVSVSDDGPGVPPEERARVFEPWVRGRGAHRDGTGLGLGLAISRRIVEAHGGAIEVRERSGGGARFAFTLPLAREAGA
jgi:signal transduction histidine kinase